MQEMMLESVGNLEPEPVGCLEPVGHLVLKLHCNFSEAGGWSLGTRLSVGTIMPLSPSW